MLATQRRIHHRAQSSARAEAAAQQLQPGALTPFDATARFELKGEPGRIVQDIINISPDAVFIAVAIGYGFEQDRTGPLKLFDDITTPPISKIPGTELTLGTFPVTALIEGFRLHPDFENVMFQPLPANGPASSSGDFSLQPVSKDLLNRTFQLVQPLKDITFLFSMLDSSSGRELMDEPVHNLAGLGKSNGERPFRALANPLQFLPRSTVRMQVIEQTSGVSGTLFIVLYGYKILVGSACPEPSAQWTSNAAAQGSLVNLAGDRAIPFDYVAKFPLTGRAGNELEDEITITTEGAFVATAIGYGLAVEDDSVVFNRDKYAGALDAGDKTLVHLDQIPLNALPPSSLLDGIRIRPDFLRVALQPGGALSKVQLDVADLIFERLNRSDDVNFRYTFYDAGTGQAWQNFPLFNIAGLGIANGLRPFKQLCRPAVLLPRSTLRITVKEQFGRGVLFIAFQGYKRVGAYGSGGKS
ncbi:MAG TPA: hypothetical protein VNX66_16255 [Candidatus Sulfotelmatobacter sp.]|jgi:hypothetical protein|nr:hypothetical protein [Candidatus Sulfotelmatobacter sp.]